MSSRALRKAQKEREKLELEKQAEQEIVEESENDDDLSQSTAKPSVFAMLNEDDAEEDEDEASIREQIKDIPSTDEDEDHDTPDVSAISTPKSSAKRKKKKKKTKNKNNAASSTTTNPSQDPTESLDEIDIALKSLSTSDTSGNATTFPAAEISTTLEVCAQLSIDTQHLHVANEMKRLFGRAAFEVDREDEAAAAPSRHRLGHGEGATLAEAVKGKNSSGGAGMPAVLRRRNIFVQGKEDWPRATGSGLSMEIVEQRAGGVVEYSFVHSRAYQHSQKEFETCVLSMDPSLMVNLLRFNPYHVSTLLQVSEIAKHEKDYSTSGDLLERALFSFGRALHSTFAGNLAQGKARLDFRRPENREFWLACWRYIGNISMRATWRTAYEWARLLLSIDPEGDPYCVNLIIDQLALRAKQADSFTNLLQSKQFVYAWSCDANIQFSRCIAVMMKDKRPDRARDMLTATIERFPWVAGRLYQELNMDKLPKGIWGRTALTPVDKLQSEVYVTLALDLWKLPDNLALLTSAASNTSSIPEEFSGAVQYGEIRLNEARFVVLTDKPALIGLLPHSITSTIESTSDPLPPEDSINTYETGVSQNRRTLSEDLATRLPASELIRSDPQQFIEEINTFQRFFELLMPSVPQNQDNAEISDDLVEQAIARSNLSVQEMRACLSRLVGLRAALVAQPGRTVRNSQTGDEAIMQDDGLVRVTVQRNRGAGNVPSRERPEIADDAELARQLMEEEFYDAEEVQRDALRRDDDSD